eukprot:TRINITY_DN4877_c0_g1_i1.p1 TRINITY_DN4877_c0_g1~~TRINITY_DN4877_c0_g1_i1.p1  ORF type:complete len:697 (+),score=221.68 TRINITY_DN4877_c0_g1_i1:126-2216(+)
MSEIPNHLICPVCQELFSNCVETPCCSNGFCQKCLDDSLKATRGTCPSCRNPCTIFNCRPNVMIQRMVDALPVGCIYCDAKITRCLVEEHERNCPAQPIPSDGIHCSIHKQPLVASCPFDGLKVCQLCFSIGSHRHHFIEEESAAGKEEIDGPTTASDVDVATAISYACLICFDSGIEVNVSSLTAILGAANIPVARESIELFAQTNYDLDLLDQLDFQPPEVVHHQSDEDWIQEESKANAEFEKLRKDYHDNQFRFQGLKSRSVPICDYVLQNANNHISCLWELKMGLKSDPQSSNSAKQERPPFALALVLDVSGSMAGGKLDRAKEAILKIIEELHDGDLLHLIKYDSQAYLVFENGHVRDADRLSNLVRAIGPMGGTGMSFGIEMGRDILIKNSPSDPRTIQKMFVFTDGQTFDGIRTIDGIHQLVADIYNHHNIGVSAFGIGMDFNAEMMKCMADAGHGHNFFIENSSAIAGILEKAFGGLTRTLATSVILKLKGFGGKPVRKFGAKSEDLFKGISLGDIREKDLKQLLVEVEVDTFKLKDGEVFDVMEYEVSYQRVDESIPEGPVRGTVQLECVSKLPKKQIYNPEVLVMLKIGECGKMDKEIAQMLDERRLDDAIAKKRKVIDALSSVVHLDQVGFAKVLLMRAKKSLRDMSSVKVSAASAPKSLEAIRKTAHYLAEEEEDGEMGFGLFD